MSKHTPGPWSWHGDELLSDRHFVLACTRHTRPSRDDARLIAAAPELLDALRKYMAAGFGNSTDFHAQGQAYDAAVEAIAKATGAQQ